MLKEWCLNSSVFQYRLVLIIWIQESSNSDGKVVRIESGSQEFVAVIFKKKQDINTEEEKNKTKLFKNNYEN